MSLSDIISPWTTSEYPTSTYMKSIDPTNTAGLVSTYESAASAIATITKVGDLVSVSRVIRGAEASLAIISAEQVLATATDDSVRAQATEVIFQHSVNLDALNWEENLYDTALNRPANIIYLAVFFLLFAYYSLVCIRSRYWWFNIAFWCGYALEFSGFLGRVLSFSDWTNLNYFLLQFVSLTIAPAFIMGGVYFTFGQLVVVYGRHFSLLKPLWYTYFFITFDVVSLVIQAIGGGMASAALSNNEDNSNGTHVMVAGIAFQVLSMSVFLVLWAIFLRAVFFKDAALIQSDNRLKKPTFMNFMRLLFNTKEANTYKNSEMEQFYNQRYHDLRLRKLVNFYPLAITLGTLAIYVRCVYRVVELAQGWTGYLITHEVFLMVLDALMIAICGIIFVVFHPFIVFGKENVLQVKHIRNNHDVKGIHHDEEEGEEKHHLPEELQDSPAESQEDAEENSISQTTVYDNQKVSKA